MFDEFNQHVRSMIVLSTSVIKLTATLPGVNNLKSEVLYRDGMSVQRNLSVKPQRQVVCSHLSAKEQCTETLQRMIHAHCSCIGNEYSMHIGKT